MLYKKQTKTSASEAFLAALNADRADKKNPFLTEAAQAALITLVNSVVSDLNALESRQLPILLTDGVTISWNVRENYNAHVTLGGDRTLVLTDLILGDYGTLKVIQGGVGGYTLTLPAGSKVVNSGAGVITLSSGVGEYDILGFYYDELGVLNVTVNPNFT